MGKEKYLSINFSALNNNGIYFAFKNSVFHRILDFKTGLDFYPGPFLFSTSGMMRLLTQAQLSLLMPQF